MSRFAPLRPLLTDEEVQEQDDRIDAMTDEERDARWLGMEARSARAQLAVDGFLETCTQLKGWHEGRREGVDPELKRRVGDAGRGLADRRVPAGVAVRGLPPQS